MHAWVRPPRIAALLTSSLLMAGCTSLLGIDGTYVSAVSGDAGAEAGPPANANTGGSPGIVVHDAGPEASTHVACVPGAYTGTFKGTQVLDDDFVSALNGILQLIPGLPKIPQTQQVHGTISFTVSDKGKNGKSAIRNGKFSGTTDSSTTGTTGTFTATLTGSFDCDSSALDGEISGSLDITVKTFSGSQTKSSPFTGTVTGSPLNGGTWNDQGPSSPGMTSTPASGSGTWTAKPP